ncbi:rCG37866 [Rattus norvegicus]|uniref:RCG37866 n=1 Tax=Rattus norvegicus TaxID=10116 RepID=A6K647_RAT|nr:rCG37866 [Rattus norvegicus]
MSFFFSPTLTRCDGKWFTFNFFFLLYNKFFLSLILKRLLCKKLDPHSFLRRDREGEDANGRGKRRKVRKGDKGQEDNEKF